MTGTPFPDTLGKTKPMTGPHPCPNCRSGEMAVFYEQLGVPVHSVTLLRTAEAARAIPRGDIALGLCEVCGFIGNVRFDGSLQDYSDQYESTQNHSGTFSAFHEALARDLVERHGLRGKRVVEIGCGQGEFLSLLCRLGGNRGIGFDPAYTGEDAGAEPDTGFTIIGDYYSDRYTRYQGDLVCCKMTLEHIADTGSFVRTMRTAVSDEPEGIAFVQIPEMARILSEFAFWDIYYEHCSYFHAAPLVHLFRLSGFEALQVRTDYDGQYLMIEARPRRPGDPPPLPPRTDGIRRAVERFADGIEARVARWRSFLDQRHAAGQRIVLWGGGSKAVAFLTRVEPGAAVAAAVDVNPLKRGTYLAGTGHPVIGPEDLRALRPDTVIVMNPIYIPEISRRLDELGLAPELVPVTAEA